MGLSTLSGSIKKKSIIPMPSNTFGLIPDIAKMTSNAVGNPTTVSLEVTSPLGRRML